MSLGAGIGSMPGEDYAESLRIVSGETPDLIAIPELPGRGVHAAMIGRSVGALAELGADLQPSGWRLTGGGSGMDQRRARSLLAQDLDAVEEQLQGFSGVVKIQVAGPWTLAASVERPRGDVMLADHGGRRELAQSLAEGVREHLASVTARVPGAALILQLDEPLLPAVLAARIPTSSGWGRHRAINVPEADEMLRLFTDLAHASGARAVLHTCAPEVPVALVADAGFDALSFDLSLATPDDVCASAFDGGLDLWPGAIPATDSESVSDKATGRRIEQFFDRLGFDAQSLGDRLVVTPTCGLAGASPAGAKRALGLARTVGGHF